MRYKVNIEETVIHTYYVDCEDVDDASSDAYTKYCHKEPPYDTRCVDSEVVDVEDADEVDDDRRGGCCDRN